MDPQKVTEMMTQMRDQMQNEFQQMKQQHAHEIQMLQAAAAAAAAGAPAAAARQPTHNRISPPPHYDGAPAVLDDWLSSLWQQFVFYNTTDDASKILFAVAHLKGPALKWVQSLHAEGREPTTWVDFDAALRANFQPITSAQLARKRLHGLEQGKSTINEYVAQFRQLIIAIPTMDPESKTEAFVRGLRLPIQQFIRQSDPQSLETTIKLAVRRGATSPTRDSAASSTVHAGGTGPSGSDADMDLSAMLAGFSGSAHSNANDAPVTRAELSMMLTAMQQQPRQGQVASHTRGVNGGRGLPKIPGFSDEKIRQYMEDGRCFGCGEKDHQSNRCPRRQIDEKGRVTWEQ